MDIKLKNSRKAGIVAAVLLLSICSLIMLAQYSAISYELGERDKYGTEYSSVLSYLGSDLSEGNYLLYNEYSKETDQAQVLSEYGQSSFELIRRYLDYDIFDTEGNAVLDSESEEIQKKLLDTSAEDYAFRASYTFSGEGKLSGIQISGTALKPEEEYTLESQYLANAQDKEYSYAAGISTPSNVTIIYGMTQENLDAYLELNMPAPADVTMLGNLPEYWEVIQGISIFVIAAALLLPLIRRLDISGMKIFDVPFEAVLLVFCILYGSNIVYLPAFVVYQTVTGGFPWAGHGGEIFSVAVNFLMWWIIFGILFWGITSMRNMIRLKGAYWRERTITAKLIRHFRNAEKDDGVSKIKRKAGGMIKKVRTFLKKQYDGLQHLDFQDKTNRTILKLVAVNYIILFLVCFLWYYGALALIVYSILLFMFLHKYARDLQEKYQLLLKSTNQLAEGHLDVPIEGDVGLFLPIQEELKKIQKGFKKAVDEEVKNERMKTELVTNVSHDLRTPLTAIITYTDLLKNETDEEKRKEYINVLERKSLRLKVLIEDLFEISKAASKNVVMHYMKVDIVDLMKQAELENDSRIREANLDFRWKLPDKKIIMWLDSQKTYRIFENLIVNIVKYAMPHTRVYIELTENEDNVSISMKNISAEELNFDTDEITDRFVRGDSSRNTEGSGLGLAIAKSFVELQHGTLKISTDADLFKAHIMLPKMEIPQEEQPDENKIL